MQTETLSCGAQKRMKEFHENKFNDYKLRKKKRVQRPRRSTRGRHGVEKDKRNYWRVLNSIDEPFFLPPASSSLPLPRFALSAVSGIDLDFTLIVRFSSLSSSAGCVRPGDGKNMFWSFVKLFLSSGTILFFSVIRRRDFSADNGMKVIIPCDESAGRALLMRRSFTLHPAVKKFILNFPPNPNDHIIFDFFHLVSSYKFRWTHRQSSFLPAQKKQQRLQIKTIAR